MGIFDFLSSIGTNDANRKMNRENNAANAALWREQTAYNTPQNQMTRLQEAGLNPNLAYGQVAESRASSAPSMNASHNEAPRMGDEVSQYQQVKNMQALNAQMVGNAESAKARAIKDASDADYTVWENAKLKGQGRLKSDPTIVKLLGAGSDYVSGVVRRMKKAGANTPTKLLKHAGSVELDHALLNNQLLNEEYGDQFDGGQ